MYRLYNSYTDESLTFKTKLGLKRYLNSKSKKSKPVPRGFVSKGYGKKYKRKEIYNNQIFK